MRSVIFQSIVLPASPETLFDMYLDPVAHAAFTGSPVEIGSETGDAFNAFGGVLTGEMLRIVCPTLIVQSWRSTKFNEDDVDSTLVLSFRPEGSQGRINLVHLDVPDHDYQGVTEGWKTHYWTPWRNYLSKGQT
jgi:activator of HSP90 ATPase